VIGRRADVQGEVPSVDGVAVLLFDTEKWQVAP
jgi:hypothetical protein